MKGLRDNSGVGTTYVKIKDYIVMNGVMHFFISFMSVFWTVFCKYDRLSLKS